MGHTSSSVTIALIVRLVRWVVYSSLVDAGDEAGPHQLLSTSYIQVMTVTLETFLYYTLNMHTGYKLGSVESLEEA